MGNGVPKSQTIHNKPKEIFHKFMKNRFTNYKTIHFGGGYVPTRHPLPSFVKNNIILAGDAGALVNPLHGGGLSPSLTSGFIAGKVAANLIPMNTLAEEDLWIYNKQIVEKYAFRYALLDLFRILLQNIPDKELEHAFANSYLPLGKIFYAREYDLLLALSRKLSQIWDQLPNVRFNLLPKNVEQINNIMINYPNSSEKLKDWARMYEKIYETYQKSIFIKAEEK